MNVIKNLVRRDVHTLGEVGIEVEVEGLNLPKDGTKLWHVERDGSLAGRDNAEYVLSKPIKFNKTGVALSELVTYLEGEGAKLSPSVRCGVHVHINVQNLTTTQVANLTTIYLVVEDLLLNVCGEGRQSNLFCLKGCEAEFMINQAANFFRTGETGYLDNNIRYSGINLAAIPKYGSVEFRAMRTPKDLNALMPWVSTLYNICQVAKEYDNPTDIIKGYSDFNPVEFLKRVCPEYCDQLMLITDWELCLKKGMRSAQDLAFSQRWGAKEEVKAEGDVDVEGLPEEIRNLIRNHPHIDKNAIINMYNQRINGNG